MASEQQNLERVVLIRLLRLNATVQGIVTGVIAGFGLFAATNWLLITAKEGDIVGPHLSLLSQFMIGYEVSFVGSLIGFVYAFVFGFVAGYGVSAMYNYLVSWKEKSAAAPQTRK
jgi:formate hydrogenlyase subunit 3/multisubunit Na+/H+ antiporter MnhD subunit